MGSHTGKIKKKTFSWLESADCAAAQTLRVHSLGGLLGLFPFGYYMTSYCITTEDIFADSLKNCHSLGGSL